MEKQALNAMSNTSSVVTLNIPNLSAESIEVEYITLPGNEPEALGNYIAVWANAASIPWNTKPLQVIQIPSNNASGSVAITGLDTNSNSYIIGYAVGPALNSGAGQQEYGNICTTLFIPAQSTATTLFSSSISVANISSTNLSFRYELPAGILPETNGAWVALWQGSVSSYNNPFATTPILTDYSSNMAAFNNIMLMRGVTYTIGFFMSGYLPSGKSTQTTLACSEIFTC